MKAKIQYHHRSKHASIDRSNPQILTSSPLLDISNKTKMILSDYMNEKNMRLVI